MLILVHVVLAMLPPLQACEPPSCSLVRGKVKSIERTQGGVGTAKVEILHVYSGAVELKGRTFADIQQLESTTGREAVSPFEVGEEGLWVLGLGEKDELMRSEDDCYLLRFRSRKGDHVRHAEHIKMAEAVESVEKAKPEERIKSLVGMTSDKTPEVGMWAVRALGASDDPAAGKFLDGFIEKPDAKLPLAVQCELDKVLCEKQSEWILKEARTKWLAGWVKGKAVEYHATRVLSRLDTAHQRQEIRTDQAVGLVCSAADNTDWPWEERRYAIDLAGKFGAEAPEDDTAFDWMMGQIKNGKDVEVRRVAAETLSLRVRLFPARLKAVEDHLATEKDSEVLAALSRAVRKAKEEEDEPKAKSPEKK